MFYSEELPVNLPFTYLPVPKLLGEALHVATQLLSLSKTLSILHLWKTMILLCQSITTASGCLLLNTVLHPAYTGQKSGHWEQKRFSRVEGIFPAGTVMKYIRPQEARFKQRILRVQPPAVRLLWFGTANTTLPDWGRAGLRKCLSRRLSGLVGNRSRSELKAVIRQECLELIS